MISAAVIDVMLGAGASCAQLAIVARQHFPEISATIGALVSADTPAAVIGAMLKAHAADCGAAAREAERKKSNTKAQQKCRAKTRPKRAEVIHLNEPELPLSSVSYDIDDSDDTADPPSPSSSSPTPPLITTPTPEIDDDDDRARVVSLISPEAQKLADQVGAVAGIDPDPAACPPGWCGAAMQVQSWLNGGWSADAILVGTRTAMARRKRVRDGPPETPVYFTKEIAKAAAQAAKPLPNVEVLHERESGRSKDQRGGGFACLAAELGAGGDPESHFGS